MHVKCTVLSEAFIKTTWVHGYHKSFPFILFTTTDQLHVFALNIYFISNVKTWYLLNLVTNRTPYCDHIDLQCLLLLRNQHVFIYTCELTSR